MAVFAPTPRARAMIATAVNPGLFDSTRAAYCTSFHSVPIALTPFAGVGCWVLGVGCWVKAGSSPAPKTQHPTPLLQLEAALFQFFFGLRFVGLLDHLTVEEVEGAVGVLGVARVVRDHADGGAARVQLAQQIHHCFAVGRVEVIRRLVREQGSRR